MACCDHDHDHDHDHHHTEGKTGCCGGGGMRAPLTPLSKEEIAQLPLMPLVARYRRGIENIDRRVFDLDERQIDQAFLPDAGVGQWPVRVLVGHLADAELAYVHRFRRAAAEESPLLAVWDENAFIDANLYGHVHEGYADEPEADEARVMHALGGNLAVIHTLRQWTGQWLMTLGEDQWERKAMHPERGALTIRTMVAGAAWHLEHHARFLTLKLDRMLGPAKAQEQEAQAGGGCCGGSKGGNGKGGCCGG